MGRANIAMVMRTPGLTLAGALDREDSPAIGKDAGVLAGIDLLGIHVSSDPAAVLQNADAIIDFTTPAASVALARLANDRGLVHVIGTTGCSRQDDEAIAEAAKSGARIVKAGNFSLGINVLEALVRKAARALGPEFDIEILEMHHKNKVDAPSGTALMLGEAAAEGRGIDLKQNAVRSRDGITGPRVDGTVGFATLRGGAVVGEHTVMFSGPAERVEIKHIASDRSLFSNGAGQAALWAARQPAGLYDMNDVLGLND
jgi:4-hydroxy-tetrahydrodipicolinate reductase